MSMPSRLLPEGYPEVLLRLESAAPTTSLVAASSPGNPGKRLAAAPQFREGVRMPPTFDLNRHRDAVVMIVATLVVAGLAVQHSATVSATAASTPTIAQTNLETAPSPARRLASASRGVERTWVAPIDNYVISAIFGQRGKHWATRHTGLDFVASWGTPVRAVTNGRVVKVARHPGYGNVVVLETEPGVTVWYCHLSKVLVKGGLVTAGTILGRVGASGNATGAHLHLEVRVYDRPTDPQTYLFGPRQGMPGQPPSWLPAVPVTTVANLPPAR
ncbi:MAG: M23 family metallopeptidase [Actinomycetes bacterium]